MIFVNGKNSLTAIESRSAMANSLANGCVRVFIFSNYRDLFQQG